MPAMPAAMSKEGEASSAAAAASPEDQRLIESILARFGPQQFAERFLAERDLGWAANLLRTFEHARVA